MRYAIMTDQVPGHIAAAWAQEGGAVIANATEEGEERPSHATTNEPRLSHSYEEMATNHALLSHAEEIVLGKQVESGLQSALDAIAELPNLVDLLFAEYKSSGGNGSRYAQYLSGFSDMSQRNASQRVEDSEPGAQVKEKLSATLIAGRMRELAQLTDAAKAARSNGDRLKQEEATQALRECIRVFRFSARMMARFQEGSREITRRLAPIKREVLGHLQRCHLPVDWVEPVLTGAYTQLPLSSDCGDSLRFKLKQCRDKIERIELEWDAPVETLMRVAAQVSRGYRQYRQGIDSLVTSNLRLVIGLSRGYMNRGLLRDDLIQEGNIGLMRAAEKYEYRMGLKFSTYATLWVKQAILRALADTSRTVRLPAFLHDEASKVLGVRARLEGSGQDYSPSAIALNLGMDEDKVAGLMQSAWEPVSIDAELFSRDGEGGTSLVDMIADNESVSIEESIMNQRYTDDFYRVLATLPAREQFIIRRRFALGAVRQESTLEVLAKELSLTRERVRQLEAMGLKRIKEAYYEANGAD